MNAHKRKDCIGQKKVVRQAAVVAETFISLFGFTTQNNKERKILTYNACIHSFITTKSTLYLFLLEEEGPPLDDRCTIPE